MLFFERSVPSAQSDDDVRKAVEKIRELSWQPCVAAAIVSRSRELLIVESRSHGTGQLPTFALHGDNPLEEVTRYLESLGAEREQFRLAGSTYPLFREIIRQPDAHRPNFLFVVGFEYWGDPRSLPLPHYREWQKWLADDTPIPDEKRQTPLELVRMTREWGRSFDWSDQSSPRLAERRMEERTALG
ncbi:MAG: hypothetical protein V4674_02990 [Patescibacteria group bacterium]